MIDNETKVVCSLAIKQGKLGAAMHNSSYEHLKLNFIYVPMTITNLKGAVEGIKAFNCRGFTVSMPYKQEVMKFLDKIDPIAKDISAVNTVSNDNGALTGYNSDWIGAVEALKEVSKLSGKTAVLIGAGGAARAIAYGLKENKAKVIVFNRTQEKAKELAKEFDLNFGGNLKDLEKLDDYDILINATSVGFYPNANDSVIEGKFIKNDKIVMDVVFNPLETPLLKLAKRKGCKIVPGYRMLIHQALFQFELFTGKKAPFKVMETALTKTLE